MRDDNRWSAALLALAALGISACAKSSAFDNGAASDAGPATVEPIKGSNLQRVILSARAAQRLGIRTAPVRLAPAGRADRTRRELIPYAAVLYDAQGRAFAYTNPAALTYVRRPITIEAVKGSVAVLTRGPRSGTPVVVVGAAELLGTEYGVEEG